MNSMAFLQRWWRRLDHERWQAFARFLWLRFLDDRCFETAGALSYTTLFALVPLSMVMFGVLAAFPVFDVWTGQLVNFVFSNFVPSSARVVEQYLREFADSARHLTVAGVIALLGSLVLTMWSIESTFNRIWRVPSARPRLSRFLVYWTLLTLGTLLAASCFAVTSYLFSLPALSGAGAAGWSQSLLGHTPALVECLAFTLAYVFIPHRTVSFRHAVMGGVLATALFELAKRAMAAYLLGVPTYQQLYGALAVVPIFMLWLYVSWVVVLLGASVAASLSSFSYQPRALQLPAGSEFYGYLRLLGRLEQARQAGESLDMAEIQASEPCLSDDLLQRMLAGLAALKIVARSEEGGWLLRRDLAGVTFGELHEQLGLRVPPAGAILPGQDDPMGRMALRALDHLRQPMQAPLAASVGPFLAFPETPKP